MIAFVKKLNLTLPCLLLLNFLTFPLLAKTPASMGPVGHWEGTIEPNNLRILFHIKENPDHTLSGTMDSPDQGGYGIPVSHVTFEKGHFHLELDSVSGSYDGELRAKGSELVGKWKQKETLTLNLKRISEKLAERPAGHLEAQVFGNGVISVTDNQGRVLTVSPMVFTEGWKYHVFTPAEGDPRFDGYSQVTDKARVGIQSNMEVLKNGIHIHMAMTALDPVTVIASRLSVDLPYAEWSGTSYQLGKTQGKIPVEKTSNIMIATGDSAGLFLGPGSQHGGLTVRYSGAPLNATFQDSRQWGDNLSVILTHGEPGDKVWAWKAGEVKDFDFTLSFNRDFAVLPTECPKASPELAGYWYGRANGGEDHERTDRFALEIEKLKKGKYQVYSHDLDLYGGGENRLLEKVTWKGRQLHVETGTATVDLTLNESGDSLAGVGKWKGKVQSLAFKRGLNFLLPRVDDEGRAVTEYSYQVPVTLADGWPAGNLSQSPLDPKIVAKGIGKILTRHFPDIEGLVVVHQGKLILDEYFKGLGPVDSHQLQSTSKSVLSILFGIAQGHGLVNVNDKLFDYFPEDRNKPGWTDSKNKILLKHLLTMTSGIGCDDWVPETNCQAGMWGSPDWLAFTLSIPMKYEPGEHWAYCNDCMELLGAVIARKSGISIPDFARKYLFEPMGIQAKQWVTGPNQVTEVCGSLWLKPRDMAKLGYLYLKKGKWKGQQLVPENWVEESTKPQAITPKDKPRDFDYGYLWWQEQFPFKNRKIRVFNAAGLGGQYIFVVPELDLVCAVTAANYKDSGIEGNPSLDFFKAYILGAVK